MDAYVERIHVFENNMFRHLILAIYKCNLWLIYPDKPELFSKPINIKKLESMIVCSMSNSKIPEDMRVSDTEFIIENKEVNYLKILKIKSQFAYSAL